MYHCGQRGRVGDGKEGGLQVVVGGGFRGRLNFCGMCIKLQPVVKVT